MKIKNKYIVALITALIICGLYFFYTQFKIQYCPDTLVINKMPGIAGDTTPREYYTKGNKRIELSPFKIKVAQSICFINKEVVY